MRTLRRSGGARSNRRLTLAVLAVALALVAGCQGSVATPTPTDGRSPTASTSTQPQPPRSPTASVRSTAGPIATPSDGGGPWEAAGTMAIGRRGEGLHAVLLGDGRVLVLGGGEPDDWAKAELWDPATGAWQPAEGLNKPRDDFAAVPLADGRVLVTGGLNPDEQSFSSTYVYDPRPGHEDWSKVGLLGTARTAPIAAVLPDGRVLVAGGYWRVKPNYGAAPGAVLADYRPGSLPKTRPSGPRLADVEPPNVGSALATAELFDPDTGEWSATGPLNFARFGGAAVTLADGRILVVGYRGGESGVTVDDRAFDSAEIYDPGTGRFTLVGRLPDIDRSAFEKLGVPLPESDPRPAENGTLVALNDGGALLVGHAGWWKHEGDISRSFRFEPSTGQWSEIGQTSAVIWVDDAAGTVYETPGVVRFGSLVAGLPDGRVLVAGGAAYQGSWTNTPPAELYDPATNAWLPLPPMPEARAGGATVILTDGSVLLVGGHNIEGVVLASAVRFVPWR